VLRDGRCVALAIFVAAAFVAGCGDDSKDNTTASTSEAAAAAASKNGPIPASLRTVESASEDIIDLALAGERAEVVRKARALRKAAAGPAAADLAKAGVTPDRLRVLKARAARVAKLAPQAPLLDVALASNQAFALVPNYFARYESPIPSDVTLLDYLDFEAKLESKAGDVAKLQRAIVGLQSTWKSVKPQVEDSEAAANFDAHVKAITKLATNADPDKTQREAQHGLDLVDELEQSFE
jgi:hypothetical protein